MPPVGNEPTISACERSQTHALDRAATGIGNEVICRSFKAGGQSAGADHRYQHHIDYTMICYIECDNSRDTDAWNCTVVGQLSDQMYGTCDNSIDLPLLLWKCRALTTPSFLASYEYRPSCSLCRESSNPLFDAQIHGQRTRNKS
jgi:hypothetical protein